MTLNISIPSATEELRPKITVIGVGGAGGNAVNNMIEANLEGVEFLVANTDGQALAASLASRKMQLGRLHTEGLGAGSKPEIGRLAAEESLDEIMAELADSHMVFITAGMGGGTGTGAAPVIARAAREQGILTVGVVTKPFEFEGTPRMRLANQGIEELQAYVDTLIVIPNQNLFRLANERTTFTDAFAMADNVLHQGVSGVTDLMIKPGMINLDFADIRSVMTEMGKAMMGTGEASGEGRATNAAEAAIHNPLLDETTLKGAQALLINITGGSDMTLFEADEAANHIRKEVDNDAIIIFGAIVDPKMEGVMRVSVVATGMEAESQSARPPSFQKTSAVAGASRITHQDSQQPFYATKRNEGVIEKIIPETTSVFPAEAEQTVPSILAKAQASHLADSHAMDMTPEAITEPAPEAIEIPEAVAEAASDIGNDTGTGDHQLSIMDFVDEEPKPSETETEAEAELAPLASASSEGADDEVPFTLGRTVDIATEELSETKEATGLMRHITRLFSSHQQKEKKAESPVISDVEPFTLPKAEPMFRSGDETDTHAVATSPSEQADQKELNTKTDELSDQHDQISLTNNTRAPELDMKDQKDEFDLEIPAFLRRQAN
ncbi:MAG: cell division protein FtsZ [Pseudomonadota bacterium]|nr:cell division protein FtsZ [Pseudomonadota bacterium]